jgi:uncharacterized membrane protein YbhN (UPF0104 family)
MLPWLGERSCRDVKEAVLAGILPPFLNEIMLVLVTIMGLVYLLIDYHLTQQQMVGISLALGLAVLGLLANKGWIRPALGAAMNVGFNMLSLYCLFLAAGHRIHPGVLVAGYGLAYLLGKVAYIPPGGLGLIEGGMTAIYAGLGIPQLIGVVVILSYGLFSFCLPTLFGFAAAGYLENK